MAHLPKRAFSSAHSDDVLLTPTVIDFPAVILPRPSVRVREYIFAEIYHHAFLTTRRRTREERNGQDKRELLFRNFGHSRPAKCCDMEQTVNTAGRLGYRAYRDVLPMADLLTPSMQLEWKVLLHSTYSPDLAPSDYYLFRSMRVLIRQNGSERIHGMWRNIATCRSHRARSKKARAHNSAYSRVLSGVWYYPIIHDVHIEPAHEVKKRSISQPVRILLSYDESVFRCASVTAIHLNKYAFYRHCLVFTLVVNVPNPLRILYNAQRDLLLAELI
ncbi:hypothetical protein ALC62_11103 [Cyphomyrmex costatus]|uniref:Uncharacterized protein n=1 Tax=Cyphomyrmex costatus TaxID=456900 RepID=A0A151ICR8_9HYME|nr:hypothetical protein ALC62_11103 [Cyphomyrmex costatus]